MKKLLTTCFALLSVMAVFAQSSAGFWGNNSRSNFAQPSFMPQEYQAHSLDLDAMRNYLRQAPLEFTAAAQSNPLQLVLPMPNGTMETFEVWESPIMEPALADQYPMIKTFGGRSLLHPGNTIRFDYSPQGFNAILHTDEGTALITPNNADEQVYLSFWVKNVDFNSPAAQQFHCEVETSQADIDSFTENFAPATDRTAANVDLFTYRLAVATTKEYSDDYGATPATVLANVVTVINNVNSVFERDLAVRVVLIANTDQAFQFTVQDPYTNGNTEMMISQNPAVLNAAFTINGYDIGHVFGTNGGGLASTGGVCNGNALAQYPKAKAASCKFGPYDGPLFYIIVGHEMGHQFNALHTFNKCDMENESPETAYEPGSGSTIMCYNGNGVCGVNHLQPTSDPYFHNNSLVRIQAFTRTGDGAQCKAVVTGNNTTPEADIPMEGGFFIPKSTPFSLTGTASDAEDPNSALTYCWEQYDLGPPSTLGSPTGTAPLFRSYPPKTTPTRNFPKIETIIAGTNDIQEILPFYDRELTFRFTVRDNHVPPGAFNYDEIKFNCTASAGPFLVSYPNGSEVFSVGEYVQATWDVANTNLSPVNCKKVNIYLSTDGGMTYPTLLLSQGDNDGAAYVVMPNMPTTNARIRVEAADNIFFDISNQNFTIEAASAPGYILTTNPQEGGLACDEFLVNIQTSALLGYSGAVTLAVNGLPAGATATFSTNPVTAGQSTTLTVNTSGVTSTGDISFNIVASSPGQPDQTRSLTIQIVDTDLSGIAATSPTDGAANQSTLPTFAWSALPNASTYDIQIATDPGFTNIVDSGTGLTTTQYIPTATLLDDQVYYWRVRASNLCGNGDFTDPFSFQTLKQSCVEVSSSGDQNGINIPSTGLPLITSKVNITQGGTISDVNVKKVMATHSALRHIQVRVKGPDGTKAILMSEPNCGSNSLNAGFNDESPNTITACPMANFTYKPTEPLSIFNGKASQGEWALELEVVNTDGLGGTFNNWTLEVCGSSSSDNPIIVKNDTLGVPPGGTNRIYTDNLVVNDADNTWDDLVFTIVKNTAYGQVKLEGQTLGVGSTFTMRDVFENYLTYTNTNTAALYDYFTFSVNDGSGGFAGTPKFNIKMDENAGIIGSAKGQVDDARFQIFPNPATSEVNMVFAPQLGKPLAVLLLDVQGRRVSVGVSGLETEFVKLNTTHVVPGLYLVQARTAQGVFVRKVVIE